MRARVAIALLLVAAFGAGCSMLTGDERGVSAHRRILDDALRAAQQDPAIGRGRLNAFLRTHPGSPLFDDAALALHRVEVAVAVPPTDGDAGDEVMQDEVVQDDCAGLSPHGVQDPAVGVGVVADVVNGEIGTARRTLRPSLHHVHVETLAERRQEERGVVGDAGRLGRHR